RGGGERVQRHGEPAAPRRDVNRLPHKTSRPPRSIKTAPTVTRGKKERDATSGCLPTASHPLLLGVGGPPCLFAARPRLACRTGHLSPHKCRPAHTGATVRNLSPGFQKRSGARARVSAATPLRGLRVRVAAPRPSVAVVAAVMTHAVVTAVMPPHGRGGGCRVVGVLREDNAPAYPRQDGAARESKFLHVFSGSPLKESGQSWGFFP